MTGQFPGSFTAHGSPAADGSHPSLDYAERRIGKKQTFRGIQSGASLVATAPKSRCRNTYGLFVASVNAGVAYPLSCGRWDCPAPSCGGLKKLAAKELFTGGVEAAWSRSEKVRSLTLTAPGRGSMNLADIYAGWNRVRSALKRRDLLAEYAAVVEVQERGAPHLHILATGDYIPQAHLSAIAQGRPGSRGRFGPVVDIREVRSTGPRSLVGNYLVKQVGSEMAAYVTKAKAEERSRLTAVGGRSHTRPIRSSRLWYPGGLAAAAETVKAGWSVEADLIRPAVSDWHLWRVDKGTGEVRPIKALSAAPEVVTPFDAPVVLHPAGLAVAA